MGDIFVEELVDVSFEAAVDSSIEPMVSIEPIVMGNVMMTKSKVVAIENEKGGVGKSTTTVNLAAALGLAGFKVLVIDLSSQANSTKTLLANRTVHHHQEVTHSIFDLLTGKKDLTIKRSIRLSREKNVWIIPGHHYMKRAEAEILPLMDSHRALRRLVGDEAIAAEFDYVIIDTAPEIKFIKQLAAMASDLIVVPVLPRSYAMDGLESMIIDLAEVSTMRDEKLLIRILLCQSDKTIETKYARQELTELYPDNLFEVDIPFRRAIASAQRHNQSIIRYASKNDAAVAYAYLAKEVIDLI